MVQKEALDDNCSIVKHSALGPVFLDLDSDEGLVLKNI